jgi:hypothetical protein
MSGQWCVVTDNDESMVGFGQQCARCFCSSLSLRLVALKTRYRQMGVGMEVAKVVHGMHISAAKATHGPGMMQARLWYDMSCRNRSLPQTTITRICLWIMSQASNDVMR